MNFVVTMQFQKKVSKELYVSIELFLQISLQTQLQVLYQERKNLFLPKSPKTMGIYKWMKFTSQVFSCCSSGGKGLSMFSIENKNMGLVSVPAEYLQTLKKSKTDTFMVIVKRISIKKI